MINQGLYPFHNTLNNKSKKLEILMIYLTILLTIPNYFVRFHSTNPLEQNFSDFNSQKEIGIMKQAIKKTDSFKSPTTQHHPESTTVKSNKTEEARSLDLNKTNLFHRYLESSCDCV
jgi:hypothetical protein